MVIVGVLLMLETLTLIELRMLLTAGIVTAGLMEM